MSAVAVSGVALAQGPGGNSGAAASRASAPSTHLPQRATDHASQRALDRSPTFGGTRPGRTQSGLDTASEHASDRAKSVAPPLGGTLPDQSQDGLKKAGEKAADKAKTVAPPLGGDPSKAKPSH